MNLAAKSVQSQPAKRAQSAMNAPLRRLRDKKRHVRKPHVRKLNRVRKPRVRKPRVRPSVRVHRRLTMVAVVIARNDPRADRHSKTNAT